MAAAGLDIEGIVLHGRNFGDSHRIVEVLTSSHGRVDLLARGGRASKKRFAGALDSFVSLRGEVSTRGNLWTLLQAQVVTVRAGIRLDLSRIARASRIVEAARILVADGQESRRPLELVARALDQVDRGALAQAVEVYPALFVDSGFFDPTPRCNACNGAHAPLSLSLDGLICNSCRPSRGALSAELLAVWLGGPCEGESLADAVEERALDLLEAHHGQPLRSRKLAF